MKLCRLACLLFAAVLVTALALGGCTGDTPQDTVKITLEYIYWADGSEIAAPYMIEIEKNAEYDLSDKTGENARIKGYVLMSTEGAVSGTALGDTLVTLYYRTEAEKPGEVTPTPSSARYFSVERDFFDSGMIVPKQAGEYFTGNVNEMFYSFHSDFSVKGSRVMFYAAGEQTEGAIYNNDYSTLVRQYYDAQRGICWTVTRLPIDREFIWTDGTVMFFVQRDEVVRLYLPSKQAQTLFSVENGNPVLAKISAIFPLSSTDVFYIVRTDAELAYNFPASYDYVESVPTAENPRVEYYVYSSLTDKSYYLGNGFDAPIFGSEPEHSGSTLPAAIELMVNENIISNVRKLYIPLRQADLDAQLGE